MRLPLVLAAAALTAGAAYAAPHAAPRQAAAATPRATAQPAEEPGFLFDAIRLPRYKIGWNKLLNELKEAMSTPDWLQHFGELDGMAGEMKPVTIDGKPYKMSFVCKPEDCAGHKFEVLFGEGGAQAFGALGGKDEPPAFFGNPSPAQREELSKAIRPVASADAPQPKSE